MLSVVAVCVLLQLPDPSCGPVLRDVIFSLDETATHAVALHMLVVRSLAGVWMVEAITFCPINIFAFTLFIAVCSWLLAAVTYHLYEEPFFFLGKSFVLLCERRVAWIVNNFWNTFRGREGIASSKRIVQKRE